MRHSRARAFVVALASILTLTFANPVDAATIPGSASRDEVSDVHVTGDVVTWSDAAEYPCPEGSWPGHPAYVTPKARRGTLAFDLAEGTRPAWSGLTSGYGVVTGGDGPLVLANWYDCSTPFGQIDVGWLDTASGEFSTYRRTVGDELNLFKSRTQLVGDEAVSVFGGLSGTRLDRATGRILQAPVPGYAAPLGRVGMAANGDLVWWSHANRSGSGLGLIARWSAATNTITTVRAKGRFRPGKLRMTGREVLASGSWLDPDTGLLHNKLSPLDLWGYHDGASVAQSGRRIGVTVSQVSSECCELIVDTRTGEWRKIPPDRTYHNEIVALTPNFVVWQTVRTNGVPVGALQYRRIASLPKAVALKSVSRSGQRVTLRWSSYRTPYRAQVHRWARGKWVLVKGQRAPRTGVIVFADPPGRQLYRVLKYGFGSRRVRL